MCSLNSQMEDQIDALQEELQEMFDSFCEMRDRALDGDAYRALYCKECEINKENTFVIASLAKALSLEVGIASTEMGYFLCINLPSGQVSWPVLPNEASDLAGRFGRYTGTVDFSSVEEQSRRKKSLVIE